MQLIKSIELKSQYDNSYREFRESNLVAKFWYFSQYDSHIRRFERTRGMPVNHKFGSERQQVWVRGGYFQVISKLIWKWY